MTTSVHTDKKAGDWEQTVAFLRLKVYSHACRPKNSEQESDLVSIIDKWKEHEKCIQYSDFIDEIVFDDEIVEDDCVSDFAEIFLCSPEFYSGTLAELANCLWETFYSVLLESGVYTSVDEDGNKTIQQEWIVNEIAERVFSGYGKDVKDIFAVNSLDFDGGDVATSAALRRVEYEMDYRRNIPKPPVQ